MSSPLPPPRSHPATHITLSSSAALESLLRLISTPAISPSVSIVVRETISRHVRLIHPSDLPLAPVDTALTSRLSSLDAQVASLSARVQAARNAGLSSLRTSLTRQVAAACAPPSPEHVPPIPTTPPYRDLATNAAAGHQAIVSRVEEVRKAAHSTRKRAASVREVLRIISDNVDVSGDVSQTIADDWTLNFADLESDRPTKRTAAAAGRNPEGTPQRSPVPLAGGRKTVFLPISPHVTPRSKMRKRLLRASHKGIRQPSFSSPLPR